MSISKIFKRSRLFYGFINLAFNQYDNSRVKQVGPDAAAAEWIVKNEGRVKGLNTAWVENFQGLSVCYSPKFQLTHIEAIDIDITSGGCKYFDGLKHITYLKLRDSVNIDDSGLQIIHRNCWNTLQYLDIAGTSISIRGFELMIKFQNLQSLEYDVKLKNNQPKHDQILASLKKLDKPIDIKVIE